MSPLLRAAEDQEAIYTLAVRDRRRQVHVEAAGPGLFADRRGPVGQRLLVRGIPRQPQLAERRAALEMLHVDLPGARLRDQRVLDLRFHRIRPRIVAQLALERAMHLAETILRAGRRLLRHDFLEDGPRIDR